DRLLDPEEWSGGDQLPISDSYWTAVRVILHLRPTHRPGLGLTPGGNFVASWTRDSERLSMEFRTNGEVCWIWSRIFNGHRHTAVSFRYSPLVLKLNATHPMYEQLLQLLRAAAASESAVKYLYNLVDDTLLLAADPGTQDLERTTIGTIARIAK